MDESFIVRTRWVVRMSEEPKTFLAALFQMRGRDTISEAEFVHEASYKLRWFTPKEAQRVLQLGLDRGLLLPGAGALHPTFDVNAVAVPMNYRPGPDALAPPSPEALFPLVIERLERGTGQTRQALVARVNRVQERLGVTVEVAAAHVARSDGVDVSDLLPEIEARILRGRG